MDTTAPRDDRRRRFPSLKRLIPLPRLRKMMESFSDAAELPCALMGPDLEWIVQVAELPHFCRLVHKDPKTAHSCTFHCQHCARVAEKKQKVAVIDCPSGLCEFVAPILIRGQLFGFIRAGHLLAADKRKKLEQGIPSLAHRLHMDEDILRRELDAVPVARSREEIERKAQAISHLAKEIGLTALAAFQRRELARASTSLAKSSTKEEAYQAILNCISAVYGPVKVGIYEWKKDVGSLAAHGTESPEVVGFQYLPNNSVVGACYKRGKTYYVPDLEVLRSRSIRPPALTLYGNTKLRSALTEPVYDAKRERIIACLQVCSTEPRAFDDDLDLSFLETLSQLLSAAYDRIDAAHQMKEVQRDRELSLDALLALERQVIAADSHPECAQDLFLRTAVAIARCDGGHVLLTGHDGSWRVSAARGHLQEFLGRPVSGDDASPSRLWTGNRPEMITSPRKATEFLRHLLSRVGGECAADGAFPKTEYVLAVPIRADDKTWGSLHLYGHGKTDMGRRTKSIVQGIADRIGVCCEQAADTLRTRALITGGSRSILDLARMPMDTGDERETVRKLLYERLVARAIALPQIQYASVRLHCPISRRLKFVVAKGDQRPEAEESLKQVGWKPVDDNSAGGHAVVTGRPYTFGSLDEAEHHQVIFEDVRSHASFPVRCAGHIVLVFSVDSTRYHAFEESGLLFERLREWVLNAESILAMLETAREQASADFGKVCREAVSVKDLCSRTAFALRDALDTLDCSVLLVTPAGDELEVAGTTGLQDGQTRENERRYLLDPPEGCTGWVGRYRKTLLIEDLKDPATYPDEKPSPCWAHKIPQKGDEVAPRMAFLGIPIWVGQEMIGVIRFSVRRDNQPFSPGDKELAERLANRLGIAVQRIGFMDRLRASRKLEGVCIRATVEETATEMAKVASDLLKCDAVHVRICQGNQLRLAGHCGRKLNHRTIRKIGEPFSGSVAKTGLLVTVQDVDADRYWAAQRKEAARDVAPWVGSMACAPLNMGGELVGTISFHSEKKNDFGVERVPIMEEIARHCALLMRHARVHEQETVRARAALKVSAKVVEDPERVTMDAVAGDVAEAFADVVPYGVSAVWLFDEAKKHLRLAATSVRKSHNGKVPTIPKQLPVDNVSNPMLSRLALFQPFGGRMPRDEALVPIADSLPEVLRAWIVSIDRYVVVPLTLGREPLGVVGCYDDHDSAISLDAEQDHVIRSLSQSAAVAFAAARLLENQHRAMDVAAPLAMMGALLDAFLHEMTQPVNNMGLLLHNAVARVPPRDDRIREKLVRLRHEVERMDLTIAELKTFVAGQGAQVATDIDLASLVRETAQRSSFGLSRDVEIEVTIPRQPVWIRGVAPVLSEALNLVAANAKEAMPMGGKLTFCLDRDHAVANIHIADTGVGMSEPVLRACRQTFFTTKEKGSGLGLAVVEAACNWHGAKLEINSELGHGTVVHIQMPLVKGD